MRADFAAGEANVQSRTYDVSTHVDHCPSGMRRRRWADDVQAGQSVFNARKNGIVFRTPKSVQIQHTKTARVHQAQKRTKRIAHTHARKHLNKQAPTHWTTLGSRSLFACDASECIFVLWFNSAPFYSSLALNLYVHCTHIYIHALYRYITVRMYVLCAYINSWMSENRYQSAVRCRKCEWCGREITFCVCLHVCLYMCSTKRSAYFYCVTFECLVCYGMGNVCTVNNAAKRHAETRYPFENVYVNILWKQLNTVYKKWLHVPQYFQQPVSAHF